MVRAADLVVGEGKSSTRTSERLPGWTRDFRDRAHQVELEVGGSSRSYDDNLVEILVVYMKIHLLDRAQLSRMCSRW